MKPQAPFAILSGELFLGFFLSVCRRSFAPLHQTIQVGALRKLLGCVCIGIASDRLRDRYTVEYPAKMFSMCVSSSIFPADGMTVRYFSRQDKIEKADQARRSLALVLQH